MEPIFILEAAVLDGPGQLAPEVRRAAATLDALPAALGPFVAKVAHQAYAVTEDDLAALRAAGQSEDQVFELTVSAAVGAGLRRFRAGMAALAAAEATP